MRRCPGKTRVNTFERSRTLVKRSQDDGDDMAIGGDYRDDKGDTVDSTLLCNISLLSGL